MTFAAQVRNWVAAAILLLTVPTFAFVTCEVYVQLMSGARVSGDSSDCALGDTGCTAMH
jgi:hypothetical protein